MFIILLPLFLTAFAIGIEKWIIVGLIQDIALSLNVEISTASNLISAYVLGIAISGPILIVLLNKINHKTALIFLIILFIIGNIIAGLASNFNILLLARVITSFTHAPFFGIASIILTNQIVVNKKSFAISMLFSGITIANIFGVPIGTLIGQKYGWQAAFFSMALIGLLSLIYVSIIIKDPLKKSIKKEISSPIFDQIKIVFKNVNISIMLLITITTLASLFSVVTYSSLIFTNIAKINKSNIPYILMLFGVGMTLGGLIGGKLYDLGKKHTISIVAILILLTQIVFYKFSDIVFINIISIFALGLLSFIIVPFSQTFIIYHAKNLANFVSTFSIVSINIGSGIGSLFATMVLNQYGLVFIPLASILFTLILLFLSFILNYSNKKIINF